nr:hypothetical protein B0A51_04506 [Rachicladosporium sp. CCFEE 5018]
MAAIRELLGTSAMSIVLLALSGISVVALLYTVVYRLYLSPIAKFPGPKLAALSSAYTFYYDVVKRGKLPWELERLHEKYGPIVRITPWEVHIVDPDFYDALYAGSNEKRDKDAMALGGFGLSRSVIATAGHDLHRMRRAALNPFFSKQAVNRLEARTIRAKIDKLCEQLRQRSETGEPVNLEHAFVAMTTDTMTEFCFNQCYDYLDRPDFSPEYAKLLITTAESSNLFRYCPFVIEWLMAAPPWFVEKLDPSLAPVLTMKSDQLARIELVKQSQGRGEKEPKNRTIFHDLIESEDLPPEERSTKHLVEAGQILVVAGSVTTVHFLKSILYFIVADDSILERLSVELKQAILDPYDLPQTHVLEQLPYLTAVIKECSRLCDGASSRLARIAPDRDLQFKQWTIPRGTSVSMSTWLQHHNADVFPDPDKFDPQRWLGDSKLDKYLVNFSRGTRGCLGINLARSEMYLTVATLIRRFDFELFETSRGDVDMAHDFFVPYSSVDSKGVRMTVKRCVGI